MLTSFRYKREINHKGKTIEYPLEDRGIRYYPLISMQKLGDIPENDLDLLKRLSTRNNFYSSMTGNN